MLNRSNLPILLEAKHLPEDFPFSCVHYTQQYRSSATLHHHDCVEIGRCISGSGLMFVDGNVYSFGRDSLSVIPRGCIHDSSIVMASPDDIPSVWRFVFVNLEALGLGSVGHAGFVTRDPRLLALFDLLFSLFEDQAEGWREETIHLLQALRMEVLRLETPVPLERENPYQQQMLLVQHKIAVEYASDLTVEGLARECSMSVSSFRRHFTAIVGVSPQQYLIQTRLSVAEHYIRNTDEKLIEISQKAGFRTLSSFNRLFLKNYGFPPGRLRTGR